MDPRLLQANERTLLAWVRTSIALMTFGFVIARIGVWMRTFVSPAGVGDGQATGTAWIGGVFLLMGVVANTFAVRWYVASRRAIRLGRDIPDDAFPVIFAVLVTALGAVIGGYVLARLL